MKKILLIVAALLCSFSLFAEVPEAGFALAGYARGGVSGNAQGEALGTANPFTAPGAYSQARFANESTYAEPLLHYGGLGEEMFWEVNLRLAFDVPGFPQGWNNIDGQIILPEAYLRMGWIDSGLSAWVGNRYHDSIAINMYDYYINDISGAYGAGVDGISLGAATLDTGYFLAYSGSDDASDTDPVNGRVGSIHSFMLRPHFTVGGNRLSLKIVPSVATGPGDAKYGAIFEADYNLESFLGFAEGSSQIFGYYDFGTGVNNNEYSYHDSDAYRTGGGLQGGAVFGESLSMRTTLMVEARGNQDAASDGIWTAFAIRPYYAINKFFGLTFEYDLDYFMYDDDAAEDSMLNRFTLAPTLTIDSDGTVFSDPVIHAYVSYAIGDMDSSVLIDGKDDQGFMYGISFSIGW